MPIQMSDPIYFSAVEASMHSANSLEILQYTLISFVKKEAFTLMSLSFGSDISLSLSWDFWSAECSSTFSRHMFYLPRCRQYPVQEFLRFIYLSYSSCFYFASSARSFIPILSSFPDFYQSFSGSQLHK